MIRINKINLILINKQVPAEAEGLIDQQIQNNLFGRVYTNK